MASWWSSTRGIAAGPLWQWRSTAPISNALTSSARLSRTDSVAADVALIDIGASLSTDALVAAGWTRLPCVASALARHRIVVRVDDPARLGGEIRAEGRKYRRAG